MKAIRTSLVHNLTRKFNLNSLWVCYWAPFLKFLSLKVPNQAKPILFISRMVSLLQDLITQGTRLQE